VPEGNELRPKEKINTSRQGTYFESHRGMDDKVINFKGVDQTEGMKAHFLAELCNELADGIGLALLDVSLLAKNNCIT